MSVASSPVVQINVAATVAAVAAWLGLDVEPEQVVQALGVLYALSAWLYRRVSPVPAEDRGFRGASAEDTDELILRRLREIAASEE